MAFQPGRNGQFTVQDSGGSVRDISAYLKDIEGSFKSDIGDTSTFSGTAHTKLATLLDGSFKVSGPWDSTVAGYLAGILGGASRAFVYGPMGSTSGNPRRTGSVICTEYTEKQSVTGLIEFSATLEITGAVTRDTY